MKVSDTNAVGMDVLALSDNTKYSYRGLMSGVLDFIKKNQLLDRALWKRFVDQFKEADSDYDGGWRGEYWGKMMMGACYILEMTKDDELYSVIEETVRDMISAQDELGRISSYAVNHELTYWDMWCRKYVMVGMEYFLPVCRDEALSKEIIECLCAQLDAIMREIGPDKKPVCKASGNWRGLNSASILEPVVLLYKLTEKSEYLDFAKYIVESGATSVCDVFELALEDKLYPYQYPVTKAYEMISCFEGLIELYRITGDEKCKETAVRFGDKLLESDFTIIGSCGCTHEFLDHAKVRQAKEETGPLMQETCVTVSVMRYLWQLTRLTGDFKYADCFERAFYNAYLGALNTEHVVTDAFKEENPGLVYEPLPFDSYSPLTAGYRGRAVGGYKVMSDSHYYGCCACIGATGAGLFTKLQLMRSENEITVLMYSDAVINTLTPKGQNFRISMNTSYPKTVNVIMEISLEESEEFTLTFRVPNWIKSVYAAVNGEEVFPENGKIRINKEWQDGDRISIAFKRKLKVVEPVPYEHDVLMTGINWDEDYLCPVYDEAGEDTPKHFAVEYGPLVLTAQQSRGWNSDKTYSYENIAEAVINKYDYCMIETVLQQKDGTELVLTDYANSGKKWGDQDKIAVWIKSE
ncbi:MAG: glycoside hydrolase family 127 protein [Clostridia bacterium]|nr:glycoside hydrolase family 127 protein [Clostridia bacterium]